VYETAAACIRVVRVAVCVRYTSVYIDRDVPAPRNGRGRRECWRAATRRLSPVRGLLLPSPTTVRGNGGGWLSPTVGTDGESR